MKLVLKWNVVKRTKKKINVSASYYTFKNCTTKC